MAEVTKDYYCPYCDGTLLFHFLNTGLKMVDMARDWTNKFRFKFSVSWLWPLSCAKPLCLFLILSTMPRVNVGVNWLLCFFLLFIEKSWKMVKITLLLIEMHFTLISEKRFLCLFFSFSHQSKLQFHFICSRFKHLSITLNMLDLLRVEFVTDIRQIYKTA